MMNEKKSESHKYPVGYSEQVIRLFSKRTAKKEARFLLPYIKKGMQILDAGCGPGSITIDFAKLVKPGKVVGIDVEPMQLEYARTLAENKKVKNITFQEASIINLPFEDDSFDLVFTNAVLCHVKNLLQAISELKRVVKPGGFVGARELDWGGQIIYPDNPTLMKAMELRERAINYLGGNYRVGRQLRKLFVEGGFSRVDASASCQVIGDEVSLRDIPEYMARQWQEAPFGRVILNKGWASLEEIREFQKALRAFPEEPGSFRCWTWVEVIGFK